MANPGYQTPRMFGEIIAEHVNSMEGFNTCCLIVYVLRGSSAVSVT